MSERSDYIQLFSTYDILVDANLIDYLIDQDYPIDELEKFLETLLKKNINLSYLNLDLFNLLQKYQSLNVKIDINWSELEKSAALFQKRLNTKSYNYYLEFFDKLLKELSSQEKNEFQEKNTQQEANKINNKINNLDESKSKVKDLDFNESSKSNNTTKQNVKTKNTLKDQITISNIKNLKPLTEFFKQHNFLNKKESSFNFSSDSKHKFHTTTQIIKTEHIQSEQTNYKNYDIINNVDNRSDINISNGNDFSIKESLIEDHQTSTEHLQLQAKSQNQLLIFKDILKSTLPFSYDAYLNSKIDKFKFNILFSYNKHDYVKSVQDFVGLFKSRFQQISSMLKMRPELRSSMPIRRLSQFKISNEVGIIGFISDVEKLNNVYTLKIEDDSGIVDAVITSNSEAYSEAHNLVNDEIVGALGTYRGNKFYINKIVYPDLPLQQKSFDFDDYFVFISDVHVGSKQFLPDEFQMFIDWLNLKLNNAQLNEIAKKVKYLFIVGDLVDGVGIYPNQDEELFITDIFEQYEMFVKYIRQIPEHILIFILPGNHDAVRLAEPQPVIPYNLAKSLWDLDNVIMLSNPSQLEIFDKNKNPLNILLYHGYSFDYYVANVPIIRDSGGYDNIAFLMKFLLTKRHLAPTYGSTLYFPDPKQDHLVISKIPDVFVSGHVHKLSIGEYKGIKLICSSCWQSRTSFQEKVGHHPEPARVPVFDPNTKQVKVLNFNKTTK